MAQSMAGQKPITRRRQLHIDVAYGTALVLWSLSSSEAVQAKLKESYRQNRHDDDLNQPLSVQPWGTDAYKRRYWLIEGRDDTHFRLYREGNPGSPTKNTWWSVAGNIDELKAVAHTLTEDRSANSRRLSERILAAIPRFEGSEEKRKRRDYRLARKAAFARPEPGFSLYEGRTRGKKIKYTYSDDEDWSFDSGADQGTRRSNRNRHSSPVDQGPVYTASGRQVRSRQGGLYGETMTVGKRRADRSSPLGRSGDEAGQGLAAEAGGRPGTRRAAAAAAAAIGAPRVNGKRHYEWEFDDGNESNGAVKEEEEWQNDEEYEGSGESDDGEDEAQRSVIVRLRYRSSGSGEEMKVKSEGTTAQDAPQLNPPNPSTNGTSFPPNSEVNTPAPPTTTATSSEAIPSPNPPSGIENINAAPSQPSIKPSPPQPVSEPLQKVGNIAYGQKQPFEVQIPLQPELGRQSMHHQFRPEAAGEYVEECAPPRS
ncbi:hypothetical protein KEM55_003773 [Ascosphaera atra]|nr:hypothetical protein KEM55_003773 [Ascosphaera atra]